MAGVEDAVISSVAQPRGCLPGSGGVLHCTVTAPRPPASRRLPEWVPTSTRALAGDGACRPCSSALRGVGTFLAAGLLLQAVSQRMARPGHPCSEKATVLASGLLLSRPGPGRSSVHLVIPGLPDKPPQTFSLFLNLRHSELISGVGNPQP